MTAKEIIEKKIKKLKDEYSDYVLAANLDFTIDTLNEVLNEITEQYTISEFIQQLKYLISKWENL